MMLIEGIPTRFVDGIERKLADIVIDPATWSVTHLVIEPAHHHEQARLLPFSVVVGQRRDRLEVAWTSEQLATAPRVARTDYLSIGDESRRRRDVGDRGWGLFPYSGATAGLALSYPMWGGHDFGFELDDRRVIVSRYDAVPRGEVEVARSAKVVSSDGHPLGHLRGVEVDPTGCITHVLLDRGLTRGHRSVAVPISAVASATMDEIQLRIDRHELADVTTSDSSARAEYRRAVSVGGEPGGLGS